MPPPDLSPTDVALIALYVVVLWAPGMLLGLVAGLRGWVLAATAPLLTYAVGGLAGPWSTGLGLRWSPWVFAASTVIGAVVLAAVRGTVRPASRIAGTSERPWSRGATTGVVVVVALAVVLGASAVLRGYGRLTTIPQDWDAVFHASGIRWIAETGDAGLFGMSQINWYEGGSIFYPNAYHVVAAVLEQITGAGIVSVLDAHTALIPGIGGLVLAVVVRRLGGSPVAAAGTALAAIGASAVYDMLWRGPLLPYATGAVLTPAFVLLLAQFLDTEGRRDRIASGVVLALGAAGLLCIHPAMLFGAVVFGAPYLLWRWGRRPSRLRAEPLMIAVVGAVALALSFLQIRGSIYSAASFPEVDWPAVVSGPQATWELLTFSHSSDMLQTWLFVLGAVGLLTYHRLGDLRWIGAPLLVFGALFVLTASSDAPWVQAVTRPWWNDRYRLVGLFALAAAVLIGHGIGQLHEAGVWAARRVARWSGDRTVPRATGAVAAVVLLAVVVLGSHVLYQDRNALRMSTNTQGPAVSPGEVAAMQELGKIVPPGERVMNDRYDGSVWMYALDGVLPVAGHYDATNLGNTDIGLLESSFNRYDDDPRVVAAVERLNIHYVMVGEGFLRGDNRRAAGLENLDGAPFLRTVFRNPQAVIYEVLPPSRASAATG
ncbi:MAG: hypothetical protein OJJ54_10645 [Pseudonocardia sp.]|nr:hypothetical protein [Pseudonocardia sp.]